MLAHLLPLTRTLRHRATAPPPCDFTARTAPPRHRRSLRSFTYASAASPGTTLMLLLLLFSSLAHPLVQAAPHAATRQLLTTVDTSSAQPTTISGARLPALALPRLARHSPRHSSPTPHPHPRPRKQGVKIPSRASRARMSSACTNIWSRTTRRTQTTPTTTSTASARR